jgi:hypothetical protein
LGEKWASLFNPCVGERIVSAMVPDKKQIKIILRKISTHRFFPILVFIAINICVGVWIVGDYGESWDEANN